MSCEKCEQYQQEGRVAYFRFGIADIEMSGCPEHLGEVMAVLRDYQADKNRIKEGKD